MSAPTTRIATDKPRDDAEQTRTTADLWVDAQGVVRPRMIALLRNVRRLRDATLPSFPSTADAADQGTGRRPGVAGQAG